jgi:prevent-host-death family protein
MLKVNMKEARRRFREVLDRVERGEDVIVMRRGKSVAKIVPVDEKRRRLPRLNDFRRSIGPKGTPSVRLIREDRDAR